MKPQPLPLDLYLVTDSALAAPRALVDVVAAAVRGGVSLVQLREKQLPAPAFTALAREVLGITRPAGVPLLINDNVEVALAAGADGVHVGQSDVPWQDVRRRLGPDAIIGLSVESWTQAIAASEAKVDYLGVSPVFCTPTKPELQHALGLDGLRAIRATTRLPLVAIGGMNADTAADTIRAGADGLAVVSAICAAPDPEAASRDLLAIIRAAKRARFKPGASA
ncbi:MAG TPA: thiamine phosphate synthase [Kiritimatiellia bacterium]|nr:thiamine phosphate synthase [Kiritimatiellia bacterium]